MVSATLVRRRLAGALFCLLCVSAGRAFPQAAPPNQGWWRGAETRMSAAPQGLFPFVLPWDDDSASVADVSSLNAAPAGRDGPVVARDGHLYAGNAPIRFLGVNVTFSACFPSHPDAEKISRRLAKFGINAVRFHHMDTEPSPDGLLERDGVTFNPDQLDRLDYFIAKLKKQGIYVDLNLHVGRTYPGMPTWSGMPQYFKGVDLFSAAMIRMQKDYARQLLTHVNPYTGARYADEPAVAFVEVNNEDSLIHEWWTGSLDRMPAQYAEELARQWQSWLSGRYASREEFRDAWGMPDQPRGAEMLAPLDSPSAWTLQVSQDAAATDTVSRDGPAGAPARVIQVLVPGAEAWHVQIYQGSFPVRKGRLYTLSFQARADSPRTILVSVMQAHEPWGQLWSTIVNLTGDWRSCRFVLAPSADDEAARVTFGNLGSARAIYRFSKASLAPGGTIGMQAGKGIESIGFFPKSDFSNHGPQARHDWIAFLWDQEERFWTGMARYLKDQLRVQSLLIGTQADFSPAPIQAELDVVDNHGYWQHPRFPHKPWDPSDWTVTDIPMAGAVDGGVISRLALQRVAGKPYIVSEYNHPAPNTFSSEAFLLVSAYAALQGWDGVFAFAYGDTRNDWASGRILGWFPIDQDPAKMVTLPAAAALFRRGDVSSLPVSRLASFSLDGAIERMLAGGPGLAGDSFGVGRTDALRDAVGLSMSDDAASTAPATAPLPGSSSSANGELMWDSRGNRGFVTIDTPRSKAVIGYTLGRSFDLGGVVIAPGATIQDWAAITLTAMAGSGEKPFASPGRILVTATGFIQNTGMGWKNPERSSVGRDWGRSPTLLENIRARITLPVEASRVEAFALDERGARVKSIPVTEDQGKASVEIGAQTPWYELVIR